MSGPVNLPGWVLSIPASLALHGVPLVLLMRLFAPSVPDIFVVELSEQPEVAQIQPLPSPRKSAPPSPRAERPSTPSPRTEAPADANPPSPPTPVAALTPEPPPRLPEPPVQPPAARPIAPAPPPPAVTPAPMPQVTEPPRPAAPTTDAVFAGPPPGAVEREAPAPVSAPAPATTAPSTWSSTTESASALSTAPAVTARVGPGAGDASQAKAGNGAGHSSDAEYRAYLGLVRQRILEALRYPSAARQQGLMGTVYLEIVVQPNGVISEVKIVTPSSHPILDQAALDTVRGLPSIGFPPGLTPRQLRARLPVMFNLR